MKRMLLISSMALCGLFLVLGSSVASAQGLDNFGTRIALHVDDVFVPAKGQTICDGSPLSVGPDDCSLYNTSIVAGANNVWIVVGQAGSVGLTGISFGLEYSGSSGSGIDPAFVGWTRCTNGLDFPNSGANGEYPAPGGGNRVTWTTCQNSGSANGQFGVHALVGALYTYAYSADQLSVTPNNNVPTPELAVTDCAISTINILSVTDPALVPQLTGRVDIAGGAGYTPCGVVNTQPTTWGKIKDQYTEPGEEE